MLRKQDARLDSVDRTPRLTSHRHAPAAGSGAPGTGSRHLRRPRQVGDTGKRYLRVWDRAEKLSRAGGTRAQQDGGGDSGRRWSRADEADTTASPCPAGVDNSEHRGRGWHWVLWRSGVVGKG